MDHKTFDETGESVMAWFTPKRTMVCIALVWALAIVGCYLEPMGWAQ